MTSIPGAPRPGCRFCGLSLASRRRAMLLQSSQEFLERGTTHVLRHARSEIIPRSKINGFPAEMQMFGWPCRKFRVLSATADTWSFAPHCRAGQTPICHSSQHHVVRGTTQSGIPRICESRVVCTVAAPATSVVTFVLSRPSRTHSRALFDDVSRRSGVVRACCSAVCRSVSAARSSAFSFV